MSHYLHVSAGKLQSKGVPSVRSRVVNLTELVLGITVEAVRQALTAAFGEVYHGTPLPFPTERLAGEELRRLEEKFASWEWRMGKEADFTYALSRRFFWGEITIQFRVSAGRVEEAAVYTDAMDVFYAQRVQQAWKGLPFTAAPVRRGQSLPMEDQNKRRCLGTSVASGGMHVMNGFDLIVIGGGPGGYVAALEAAKLGKTVVVVERDAVGGTCLNRGCIPTKALLRASRVFREATCSEELGIHVQNASCDRAAMYAHVQKVTAQLRSGIELLFQKGNITLLHGSAQIEAPGRVLVDGTPYEAQNLLIATGSLPAMPPIPGIHLPGVVTSDQLLQGDGVDCKRLAIIGGGVIGVEFAQIYSDLGCAVTILEALPRLLPTMDREISQNLSMILKKRGVSVYTGASVQEIASGDGELLCRFRKKAAIWKPRRLPAGVHGPQARHRELCRIV
ncbi:MAG: FAD-dependent oxidoreductase, partial [Anaeromassilibacillus sp.]